MQCVAHYGAWYGDSLIASITNVAWFSLFDVNSSNNSDDGSDEKEGRWRLRHADNEQEAITYFFHFLMFLAVLYFMMQFTNWA